MRECLPPWLNTDRGGFCCHLLELTPRRGRSASKHSPVGGRWRFWIVDADSSPSDQGDPDKPGDRTLTTVRTNSPSGLHGVGICADD
jgi:hypothetical protein